MSHPADSPAVIHDLGYRPYAGPRHGAAYVSWSLYKLGLRHAFGLGRSGKSKVLPFGLFAVIVLPTLILVGVVVQIGLEEQIVEYTSYPVITQLIISVFVAAQAPVLFSRDIRFRTVALYFARPLPRSTFVLVRYASLASAVFVLIATPLLVLYIGGLLADLPLRRETADVVVALIGAALLAALLAGFAAVIAAVTTRRGLAIAAIIVALVVTSTVVSAVQGISFDAGTDTVGVVVGVFSPYTLVDGVLVWGFGAESSAIMSPESTAGGLAYLGVAVLTVAAVVALLVARYRRLATG